MQHSLTLHQQLNNSFIVLDTILEFLSEAIYKETSCTLSDIINVCTSTALQTVNVNGTDGEIRS